MPNAWITALKTYNEGKKWIVPRKGTPAYDEVKALMVGGSTTSTVSKEPKTYGGMMRNLKRQLVKAEAECENVDAIKNKIRMLEIS